MQVTIGLSVWIEELSIIPSFELFDNQQLQSRLNSITNYIDNF